MACCCCLFIQCKKMAKKCEVSKLAAIELNVCVFCNAKI